MARWLNLPAELHQHVGMPRTLGRSRYEPGKGSSVLALLPIALKSKSWLSGIMCCGSGRCCCLQSSASRTMRLATGPDMPWQKEQDAPGKEAAKPSDKRSHDASGSSAEARVSAADLPDWRELFGELLETAESEAPVAPAKDDGDGPDFFGKRPSKVAAAPWRFWGRRCVRSCRLAPRCMQKTMSGNAGMIGLGAPVPLWVALLGLPL